MEPQRHYALLLPLWVSVLLVAGPSAFAGPDLPAITGDTATFTGDQSNGILSGVDFLCPPIYTLDIYGLTTDIMPAVDIAGVQISRFGANGGGGGGSIWGDGGNGGGGEYGGMITIDWFHRPFPLIEFVGPTVNFTGGDYDIITSGTSAYGISTRSAGGKGGKGGWATPAFGVGPSYGGNGGSGGSGAPVTVTSNGNIQTDGDLSYGIFAESRGGNGGGGGWAASSTYSKGGAGGSGGGGGEVDVLGNGSIETASASSPGILALSEAGDGGGGGDAGAIYGEGGTGGVGGSGGRVHVDNGSRIDTGGASADGISAQSLGGAGGSGGTGGGVVGKGGGALGSGPGGPVVVENSGDIGTSGTDSRGIFAQSVGGFTGSAGGGGGLVGWGGSGNSAGDGQSVTVLNSGAITTEDSGSTSIFAQSVGGGGGSASGSGGLVSLGGAGSAGGSGGDVAVTNSARLETSGDDALGILAQSIGGGGGSGGSSGGLFSIGGSGDSTGDGGTVTVVNTGAITTAGDGSGSIFAESVGGGGGVSGGRGKSGDGIFVSIGGDAGAGGDGGTVMVSNSGRLETSGIDSSAVLAQSIGGGGGSGGGAYDVGLGFTYAQGGDSAPGGQGGQVSVDSGDTSIITAGALSHGIHALSVGGGGGSGGNVLNLTGGIQFSMSYGVGGRGGGGGDGGLVDLTSGSQVTTEGEHAHGLYAQSVGGGGGSGGNAVSWSATIGVVDQFPAISAAINLGGTGGDGGRSGAVAVDSTGDVLTSGFRSYGILAQSVGGGGGDGGNSMAGTIAVNSLTVSMAVGGAAGGAGNGDSVSLNSGGKTTTEGDFSYGILAQSVGGGGGAGGNSTTLMADIGIMLSWKDLLPSPDITLGVSVGGDSGSGGGGGSVVVDNAGYIDTMGEFSHGIVAQSVGGGGGAGGDSTSVLVQLSTNPTDYLEFLDFMRVQSNIVLGGSGGAGGDGDAAGVQNSGDIVTEGNFATGILAQSIGGGGGANGSVTADTYDLLNMTGSDMVLRGNSGGSGDGDAVTVENSANITTQGGFAHGIVAQSVGGGGGFAGISEDAGVSTLSFGAGAGGVFAENTYGFGVGFAGSAGGSGAAGAVNVTHTGSILTLGDGSHGILAQSAAGSGLAGPVTVTVGSEVIARGADCDGIHAQSVGGGGRGDIAVNILGGTIQGGSGTGAGVNLDGGAANTLSNSGSISALSGTAILGGIGDDRIDNYGTVIGGVNLGGGSNVFNNNLTGRLDSGTLIDLGEGNTFTNAGVLSPGGSGTILDTLLVGDLLQLGTGILEIDVGGFAPGTFDTLSVTGLFSGESDPLALSRPTINICFSFLSSFDLASEIAAHESLAFQFLSAGSVGSLPMSYRFSGCPEGFYYSVFWDNESLYLRASNTIPSPGALLLTSIGLGFLGWRRRKVSS